MSEWKHFQEIDYNDKDIKQIHIDTRDFHAMTRDIYECESDKVDQESLTLPDNTDRFLMSGDEVKQTLNRLFKESGGDGHWRMLSISGHGALENWNLKYLRIYRIASDENKWVICNNLKYTIRKGLLDQPINQELLCFRK